MRFSNTFFAAKASEALLNSLLKSRALRNEIPVLTDRERELVQLLAMGKSNKEAAAYLGISVKTVETHRSAIMRKLEFNSIAELVRYAVRERIIKARERRFHRPTLVRSFEIR